MGRSRGEIKVSEILQENNVNFKEEYSFPDLVSNRNNPLRFDFAVFNDDDDETPDFLIEVQGEQHYVAKAKFGGEEGLRRQQRNDMLKREYCKRHGIPLVIIPYTILGMVNYDFLMKAGYGWQ